MTPPSPSDRPPPRPPGPPPLRPAPPALRPMGSTPPRLSPEGEASTREPAPVVVIDAADRNTGRSTPPKAAPLFAGLAAAVVAALVLIFLQFGRSTGLPESAEVNPATTGSAQRPEHGSIPATVSDPPTFAGRSDETLLDGDVLPPRGQPELSQALFQSLWDQLEAAGHQPIASLDATNPREQEAELVEVGDLAIAVSFPTEPLPTTPAAVISCLPTDSGRWRLEMRTSLGMNHAVGGLLVRDGVLVATLPPRTADNEVGRAAVAAGLVRIAAQRQPGGHSHVQLRRTVELLPVVFHGMAFDSAVLPGVEQKPQGGAASRTRRSIAVPASPWPCWPVLRGRCGDAAGLVAVIAEGTPFALRDQVPATWSVAWVSPAAPDGPFLVSQFALEPGQPGLDAAVVRMVVARVPDAWRSYRRFGGLEPEAVQADAGLLPTATRLRAEAAQLPPVEGVVSAEALAEFAKVVVRLRRPEGRAAVTASLVFQSPNLAGRRLPLAEWMVTLRQEFDRGDAIARVPLQMLLEELTALPAGKRLAVEVVAGLGTGAGVFTGRLETRFPSLNAVSVIAKFGAEPVTHPRSQPKL